MSMLLLQGCENGVAGQAAMHRVRAFCDGLVRGGQLDVCVALLPSAAEPRGQVLGLLQELRRGGAVRTAALLRGEALEAADLTECHDAGLDEVMIVQGGEDATPAIEQMMRLRELRPGGLPYRLWLEGAAAGALNARVRAWEHFCPRPASVEMAPFAFPTPEGEGGGEAAEHAQEWICDWQRAVITLDGYETLLACPAQPRAAGVALATARRPQPGERWGRVAGAAASPTVCGDCKRLVRFAVPEWMWSQAQDAPAAEAAPSPLGEPMQDCGDLGSLPEPRRGRLLEQWLERVATSARGGGRG